MPTNETCSRNEAEKPSGCHRPNVLAAEPRPIDVLGFQRHRLIKDIGGGASYTRDRRFLEGDHVFERFNEGTNRRLRLGSTGIFSSTTR